jgi:hypothetical protein
MGVTYRFIADPAEPSEVLAWFRALPSRPTEVPTERGCVLYFTEFGQLAYEADGKVNAKNSPVATVFLPKVRRGVMWTVGEVHFLATPFRSQFPGLHKISRELSKWLAAHECAYSNERAENPFAYYLEGSVKNYDSPVFAFTSGIEALRLGRYFVGDDDNDYRLDAICKSLRLRGVSCTA